MTTLLTPAQRIAWLRLLRTDNVGPVTFRQLLNRFGSAEAAIEALPALAARAGRPARVVSAGEAEDEIAGTARLGGRFVAQGEADYPPHLRHIPGAPPLVAIAGGENIDWRRTVGIVGARNASAAGEKMTRLLATDLGERGYTVVSGLARGIDAAAHRASLRTGTVAVLAGGLDRIYPDQNIPLAREIVAAGGALLTEMPLGWEPRAAIFRGVTGWFRVCRSDRGGGGGQKVGIADHGAAGARAEPRCLCRAGLAARSARRRRQCPHPAGRQAHHLGRGYHRDAGQCRPGADGAVRPRMAAGPDEGAPEAEPAADDRARLLSALSVTPIEVDELVTQTGLGPHLVQILLLELDLAGRLDWSSGQLVALRES